MGRSPCCDKVGLKKGPWTPEEDQKLLAYIDEHGHGSWRALPAKAGLQRCGKSCRLRWTNYLRPDIKRGKFSLQEEQTIIQLHALLGNRWSAIATHLPKRTDNEIKNYWNTHLKKRLTKMGIDPVTHKPKNDALLSGGDGQSKTAANLSHMAQWESARLEAEARLVRESKLRSHLASSSSSSPSTSAPPVVTNKAEAPPLPPPPPMMPSRSLAWHGGWLKSNELGNNDNGGIVVNGMISGDHLESPTSTLSFSENNAPPPPPPPIMGGGGIFRETTTTTTTTTTAAVPNSNSIIEFVGTSGDNNSVKEEGAEQEWKGAYDDDDDDDDDEGSMANFTSGFHEMAMSMEGAWASDHSLIRTAGGGSSHDEGFTNLLLNAQSDNDRSLSSEGGGESNNNGAHDVLATGCGGGGGGGSGGGDFYEDNKNYWNSILNLVNSSPSDSPMF